LEKKVIILGAGLTGLSCAYHLKKDYLIFEKEDRAGGLCRSEKANNFTFDYTGHLLHFHNIEIETFVKKLLGDNLAKHKRSSWVYSHKVYTRYPFQANLYGLPKKVIKECLLGFLETRCSRSNSQLSRLSFHNWVLQNFGYGFAKHFFFPYNQKVWTVTLDELTCDWLNPFVPQPKLTEVIEGALTNQNRAFGYNVYFYYPRFGGIGSLIEGLSKRIGNLHLSSPVTKVYPQNRFVEILGKEKIPYSHLVSTMPLPELVKIIEPCPTEVRQAGKRLRWNSVSCINLGINRIVETRKHWIYFPEKRFIFYRVGFYHNFSSALVPKGCSSMYIEIAHRPNEFFDTKKIMPKVYNDLRNCGILRESDKILVTNVLEMPYAYVIYDKEHLSALTIIKRFLQANGIFSIGRFGAWRYSYMEESILDGKNIAEILNSKSEILNKF